MLIKKKDLAPLLAVNKQIMNNTLLKQQLDKPLMTVLSAQKNVKSLEKELAEFNNDVETVKKEAASKDESGKPITTKTPQGLKYEIPEEKVAEAVDVINSMADQEVKLHLNVFSEATCDVVIKFVGEQTDIFIEHLMEKAPEEVK